MTRLDGFVNRAALGGDLSPVVEQIRRLHNLRSSLRIRIAKVEDVVQQDPASGSRRHLYRSPCYSICAAIVSLKDQGTGHVIDIVSAHRLLGHAITLKRHEV